jgi:hypothetical protein
MTLKSVRDEEHERMQLAGVSAGAYHRGAETVPRDDTVTTRLHLTLQSDAINVIKSLILLVHVAGAKPSTHRILITCSTVPPTAVERGS